MGDADIPVARAIERRAGQAFRSVGLDEVAEHEPMAAKDMRRYVDAGRAWVALDEDDDRRVAGYVLVDLVDGCAHVEQLSVDPDHQGRGHGRALLVRVAACAQEAGLPGVTLTTFDQVPWNRPLYEHLGFRVLAEEEIGPDLREVRAHEAALGLDPAARVCMRRDVS